MRILLCLGVAGFLAGCGGDDKVVGGGGTSRPFDTTSARLDTADTCTSSPCDASPPSIPVVIATGGAGDVTTYGGVNNANPSRGGACNYGVTGITHYAAIQVSLLPGDLRGQWNGGRICGQCVRIRARTPTGWRSTVARIVDKCPDDHCGIDLGGAPATDLMGAQAGRYSGEWSFVPCDGLVGVFDGPRTLWTKEGTNPYWSLVQVRNPPSAVDSLLGRIGDGGWIPFAWAIEAENFFRTPDTLLRTSGAITLRTVYRMGAPDTFAVTSGMLAQDTAAIPMR